MSAEAKPVDAPVVAPAAEPAVLPTADVLPLTEPAVPAAKPVEETPALPATEEVKTEEPAVAAAAPVEATKKSEEKPVEPITEGNLVYKAPAKFPKNLVPGREHRYFFYFGDAAVPSEKLSGFHSTVKADYAHEAAAWSSQTGKGLLYYSKTKEDKESPAGVLPLSEVTDIREVGTNEFTFKIAEHKHVFLASSSQERAGWIATLKPEVEAAAGKKEEIHGSEGFKKTLESFKPAVVAASVVPKKSAEAERAPRDENLTTKDKAKSRSVSRGKGIFDRFGKKEAAKEDVKKEETAATDAAPVVTDAPATEAAPAVEPVEAAPATASAAEVAPVVAAAPLPLTEAPKEDVTKAEKAPKGDRRSSKFGDFFKKVTSPTTEKKESEIVPAAGAVEAAEAKKSTDAEVVEPVLAAPAELTEDTPVVVADASAPAVEAVGAPNKEKKKFGLPNLFDKKAKTTDTAATETTPAAAVEPVPATEGEAPVAAAATSTDGEAVRPAQKEKRRSSFFGDLTGSMKKTGKDKKAEPVKDEAAVTEPTAEPAVVAEPATETAPIEPTKSVEAEAPKTEETKEEKAKKEKDDLKNKISGLGRRLSTAIRGNKEKKAAAPPATVEESAEGKTSATAPQLDEPKLDATKPEEPIKTTEETAPKTIGDVVPEAVNIGSAPVASPTVSATA